MKAWEKLFEEKIKTIATSEDPAHDFLHFQRVVATAKKLCESEGAQLAVVAPAAWLHDFVIVPKNSPLREKASKISAEKAIEFLKGINYPEKYLESIGHAIEAHSFSANITAQSLEAKIVQDADRLDGLGAIGIARCFATAGLMKRSFYSEQDPFCITRPPNDKEFTLDHFFQKLFRTSETLQTHSGRKEGLLRATEMQRFLETFKRELAY